MNKLDLMKVVKKKKSSIYYITFFYKIKTLFQKIKWFKIWNTLWIRIKVVLFRSTNKYIFCRWFCMQFSGIDNIELIRVYKYRTD